MTNQKAESEHEFTWVELCTPLVNLCTDQAGSWCLILVCHMELLQLIVRII